jgi:hypothetical protein
MDTIDLWLTIPFGLVFLAKLVWLGQLWWRGEVKIDDDEGGPVSGWGTPKG